MSSDDIFKAVLIVVMSIFAALAGYIRRIRKAAAKFLWAEFAMELVVSLFCAFVAWQCAVWLKLQEPLVILTVAMASFAGSKSADFFEDLYFALIEKLAKTRVSDDKPD
jgi:hypothetical protein